MKVGIISDGKFGERAFANIKEKFEAEWILVPDIPSNVMLDEPIKLDIPDCDLYLSYVRHPDVITQIAQLKKPMILGITPGIGLAVQLRETNPRIVAPRTMCSLEPTTGIPEIDEFAKFFGKPSFQAELDSAGAIETIKILRSSPCGSSSAGAGFIQDKEITPKNLQDFALAICHECRAPRFGHTCDKEVSGLIHILAFLNGTDFGNHPEKKEELRQFIDQIQAEYQTRTK